MEFIIIIVIVIASWIILGFAYQDIVKRQAFQHARKLTKEKGILNAGSGSSRSLTAKRIASSPLVRVNIDISCKETPHCLQGDLNKKLPFPDKSFDVYYISHVLEHLNNPETAMREAQRVADWVIVVLPPKWAITNWLDPDHKRIYSKRDIKILEKKYPGIKVFS
ncbi:MAG: class I SAM-dependent methyltransferase [Candidatus Nealsonbacteria bacterium]|nr:class I SAM-dependent methyltransferase [Candidatus Nealsonbacteria bacterium]